MIPEIKIKVTVSGKKSEAFTITSPEQAHELFRRLMSKDGLIHYREEFLMLCLSQASKVIGYYRVSIGGMTGTVADTRTIATIALNACATSIIVAHNHPSGNLSPSQADIALTTKLRDGLKLLDITLLDHLIITDEGHYSVLASL